MKKGNKNNSHELPSLIYVECYSGYKVNERPIRFLYRGKSYRVISIIDRWYGIDSDYFKVLGEDGRIYIIKWNRYEDYWSLLKIMEREVTH